MTVQNCFECGKPYDPETVTTVSPLPDNTCYNCMNVLTDEEKADYLRKIGVQVDSNQPSYRE